MRLRPPVDVSDAVPSDHLQPDGLPDAGGAPVPDRVRWRLPILLAARLAEVVRIVLGPHHDHGGRRSDGQRRRDVCLERRVPALVPGHVDAVDPNIGAIIDRPEVEQESLVILACERVKIDLAPVPDHAMRTGIVDAAGRRLRRKRRRDRAVERGGVRLPMPVPPDVVRVEGELPFAGEVVPVGAGELRVGVLVGEVIHAARLQLRQTNVFLDGGIVREMYSSRNRRSRNGARLHDSK